MLCFLMRFPDLLKENAAVTLANFIKDRPIDILISNAGVGSSNQHFQAVSSTQWLKVLKVNLIVPLMITQAVFENVKKSYSSAPNSFGSQTGKKEQFSRLPRLPQHQFLAARLVQ